MLVATVAPVATIAEQCVSIYRYRRWNTFFDDSGDSSDGSDYMKTRLKPTTAPTEETDLNSELARSTCARVRISRHLTKYLVWLAFQINQNGRAYVERASWENLYIDFSV